MPGDGLRFPRSLGGDLRQERVEGLLDKELLDGLAVGQAVAVGNVRALGRQDQVQENVGWRTVMLPSMLAWTTNSWRCRQLPRPSLIEAANTSSRLGRLAVQVVEHGAPLQVVANPVG